MKKHRSTPEPAEGPASPSREKPASGTSSAPPDPVSSPGVVSSGAENAAGTPATGPTPWTAELIGGAVAPPTEASEDAESRAADYLDRLQRLKAEFDNYRRRTAKERETWFSQGQAEVVEALLPVLDDLRRAREHAAAGEATESEGWRLILKRFEDTLERLGLELQGVEPGREFDPEQHDAVMAEASAEVPPGMIISVLEPGYQFRGRLLRRSRISCSTGPAGE
jgi:molecular chaperone GrpE